MLDIIGKLCSTFLCRPCIDYYGISKSYTILLDHLSFYYPSAVIHVDVVRCNVDVVIYTIQSSRSDASYYSLILVRSLKTRPIPVNEATSREWGPIQSPVMTPSMHALRAVSSQLTLCGPNKKCAIQKSIGGVAWCLVAKLELPN